MDILQDMGIEFDYIAVDISSSMVEMAKKNVKRRYRIITDSIVVDLENRSFHLTYWKGPTIFLFLESNIVNFSWPEQVMWKIRAVLACLDGDVCINTIVDNL